MLGKGWCGFRVGLGKVVLVVVGRVVLRCGGCFKVVCWGVFKLWVRLF